MSGPISVEADSDGRIKIDRFPSMQLGGTPPQLIDQAIDGVADIIWTVAGYTPGRFPQLEVFELPFMSPDAEATSRAYWELAEARMMDTDFAEFKPLGPLGAWPRCDPRQPRRHRRGRPARPETARADADDDDDVYRTGRHVCRACRCLRCPNPCHAV